MSRRLRLIWHKLWLLPLVGATADVVAGEAAKLGGVTVPFPWLFSAIGVAGMLAAAVVRAYSVPLIPEGLETPDEALTRRSRILGERLGATPVRVFVSDLPKLRGKVDTFLDGHDLFVSKRVAALPEAERDFVLAQELYELGPWGTVATWWQTYYEKVGGLTCLAVAVDIQLRVAGIRMYGLSAAVIALWLVGGLVLLSLGLKWVLPRAVAPLAATGNLLAAIAALQALADSDEQLEKVVKDAAALEEYWSTKGQKAVEASEWYQRERSLAAKAE